MVTKHKVKSSLNNSKKMNSKTWLIGGIAGVIVLVVLAVTLYSPIKGAMFGKAVSSEDSCPYNTYPTITEYVDAFGEFTLGKSAAKGCCPNYKYCYSSFTQECYGEGIRKSNLNSDSNYFCVASDSTSSTAKWYVCNKGGGGIVWGGFSEYICAKEGWVNCMPGDDGNTYLNYVCHDYEWIMFTPNSNPKNPTFSDIMNYQKTNTYTSANGAKTSDLVLQWKVEESALDSPTRMGECPKSNQCITKGGDCKDFGFIADELICGYNHRWLKCGGTTGGDWDGEGVASDDRKYVCSTPAIASNQLKWVKCDASIEGSKESFMGKDKSQCKGGYWIDLDLCKDLKSGEKCIYSEMVVKTGVNKLPLYTVIESAEKANRIGAGKGKQCLNANHKAVNYDTAYTSPEYVCGDNNRWLKCTSDAKNVVSDGGNFICDGSKWQKIDNQKKGCSNCASSEFCVASHLYPSYSIDAGNWAGWKLPYESKRVGCSSDSKGCADTNGVGWIEDSVKDNIFICSNNKWYTCSESGVDQIIGSYFFCATGENAYAWLKCGSDGGKPAGYLTSNKQTLCTNEGWHNCIKSGISDADASWMCVDGKGWSKCDSPDDVEVAGLYTCDGKSWSYNFVDFGGVTTGGGKTGPLSSGNTGGTLPAAKGPR